ncbi:hypothetical protein ACFLWS_03285 [Chloroflexota bacterium]
MAEDIIDLLESYVAADNPSRWAKLSSTVESRRLELLLLKEILLELREMNKAKQLSVAESEI